jgi:multidrug resistance efflux pump
LSRLNALDNQQVKQGQVLFHIDPKPYQLRGDQPHAAVARAHAQSLINGAALAFAASLLTSSADYAPARHR